jgi:hypothetical protein
MNWRLSYRADPRALPLADRHYSRQKIGTPQFVPPGRCIVLLTKEANALWVTSFPFAQFVRHAWAGAWMCSLFRNESEVLSSELIKEAVSITRGIYGEPPALGMVTFIDTEKVRPLKYGTKNQRLRNFGASYTNAGFKRVGWTKGGLLALQLLPLDMPPPLIIPSLQGSLFEQAA